MIEPDPDGIGREFLNDSPAVKRGIDAVGRLGPYGDFALQQRGGKQFYICR
jgi:hypothetical protein